MRRTLVVAGVVALGLLSACTSEPEGPGQKVGEALDETRERVEDAVDPKGPAEKAGRAVDRAVDGLKQ